MKSHYECIFYYRVFCDYHVFYNYSKTKAGQKINVILGFFFFFFLYFSEIRNVCVQAPIQRANRQ